MIQLKPTKDRYPQYKIGEYTYGAPRVLHAAGASAMLHIGNFCSIADDSTIILGAEHRTDWISTYPFNQFFEEARRIQGHPATKGDVVIGNDVWIGFRAIIMSGIAIGSGAVIGAGSVVSRNVGPYEVWAGNPARKVRERFSQEDKLYLLKLKWWYWDIEKIKKNMAALCASNVKGLRDVS